MSYVKRLGGYIARQMLVALLLVIAQFLSTLVFAIFGMLSWPTLFITFVSIGILFIGSMIMLKRYERQEALGYLKKLKRLGDDFHDLTMRAVSQSEDIRIVGIMDLVPYHSLAGVADVAVPSDQIHLYKNFIRNANHLIEAWFNEHSKRLDFYIENPRSLDRKNFVDLVQRFKWLIYEYHEKVIDESIHFMNKAGFADKDAKIKFNEFKDRYNQFAERLRSFLKDLKDAGYDIGMGWDVKSVSKELETKTATGS